MIIKPFQGNDEQIAVLEGLLPRAEARQRARIEQEIRFMRAGAKAEKEAAYYIDFRYGDRTPNLIVIHDLRLEIDGRVAQIDHLIIDRMLDAYVCESKGFHAGVKVTEHGEFMQWNDFKKRFEGIRSPVEQNDRHISVLKDAFRKINSLPKRLGAKLMPKFKSLILVSASARIDRPDKKVFNTDNIIRSDQVTSYFDAEVDKVGFFSGVSSISRIISAETLQAIGRELAAFHAPISIDYEKRFGISPVAPGEVSTVQDDSVLTQPESDAPATQVAPFPHREAANSEGSKCTKCEATVEKKVVTYCVRFNKKRFGGKVYCQDCQASFLA